MLTDGRVLAEQQLLGREYPDFRVNVEDDGTIYAHGWIGSNISIRGRYHVLLVLPPSYSSGAMPLVNVIEPRLADGAPHRFQDGALCLDHSGAFTGRSTLVTILAWVSMWLCLYEGWLETGDAW